MATYEHVEFMKSDWCRLPETRHTGTMKRLWLLTLLVALYAPRALADFPDAVAAYDAGDYAAAFEGDVPVFVETLN